MNTRLPSSSNTSLGVTSGTCSPDTSDVPFDSNEFSDDDSSDETPQLRSDLSWSSTSSSSSSLECAAPLSETISQPTFVDVSVGLFHRGARLRRQLSEDYGYYTRDYIVDTLEASGCDSSLDLDEPCSCSYCTTIQSSYLASMSAGRKCISRFPTRGKTSQMFKKGTRVKKDRKYEASSPSLSFLQLIVIFLFGLLMTPMILHSSQSLTSGVSSLLIASHNWDTSPSELPQTSSVDAVVFVAIGPVASSPVLEWSVSSVVEHGQWRGPVYVITDQPEAVTKSLNTEKNSAYEKEYNIIKLDHSELVKPWVLEEPAEAATPAFSAKLIKCRLLDILPTSVQRPLYIDSDIIVGNSFESFWKNLERIWGRTESSENTETVSMALLEDGNAFRAGFCKDCDTYNTGVISLRRGQSEACLNAWCDTLAFSGGTDQGALDKVIEAGEQCQDIVALDTRQHVRMMKDVFVILGLVGSKTFNHFTGLFRPNRLSTLHRFIYQKALQRDLTEAEDAIRRGSFAQTEYEVQNTQEFANDIIEGGSFNGEANVEIQAGDFLRSYVRGSR